MLGNNHVNLISGSKTQSCCKMDHDLNTVIAWLSIVPKKSVSFSVLCPDKSLTEAIMKTCLGPLLVYK